MPKHSEYVRELLEEAKALGPNLRPLADQLHEAEALGVDFEDMRGRTRLQAYYVLFRRFSRKLGALGYPQLPHPVLTPMLLPVIDAEERRDIVRRARESTVALPAHRRPSPLELQMMLDLGFENDELVMTNKRDATEMLFGRVRDMTLENVAAMRKMDLEELHEALEDRQPLSHGDAELLAAAQFDGWEAHYLDGRRERRGQVTGVEVHVNDVWRNACAPAGMQVLGVLPSELAAIRGYFPIVLPVRASMLRTLTPPRLEDETWDD